MRREMNCLKDYLVNELSLNNKIDCGLCCYLLDRRKYLIVWDKTITKENIKEILDQINKNCQNEKFDSAKSIIVVGYTTDVFKKAELQWFDGVSTFAIFYLINEENKQIYMNDSWIFILALNYKKYVRKIDAVLRSKLNYK
jgi:hypothetical protein